MPAVKLPPRPLRNLLPVKNPLPAKAPLLVKNLPLAKAPPPVKNLLLAKALPPVKAPPLAKVLPQVAMSFTALSRALWVAARNSPPKLPRCAKLRSKASSLTLAPPNNLAHV